MHCTIATVVLRLFLCATCLAMTANTALQTAYCVAMCFVYEYNSFYSMYFTTRYIPHTHIEIREPRETRALLKKIIRAPLE